MKIPAGKLQGAFIVRDAHGHVKFDNWDDIPEVFHPYLTAEDWQYIEERQNGHHTKHGGA